MNRDNNYKKNSGLLRYALSDKVIKGLKRRIGRRGLAKPNELQRQQPPRNAFIPEQESWANLHFQGDSTKYPTYSEVRNPIVLEAQRLSRLAHAHTAAGNKLNELGDHDGSTRAWNEGDTYRNALRSLTKEHNLTLHEIYGGPIWQDEDIDNAVVKHQTPDFQAEKYKRYQAIKYSEIPIHPDYAHGGIAFRIGNGLKQVAQGTGDSSLMAKHILETGEHQLLPILADKLEEEGHPAKDLFDWRYAGNRGIQIDNIMNGLISSRRVRVPGRLVPLTPGWMISDWSMRRRAPFSRRTALNEIRKHFPDAKQEELLHSVIRLFDRQLHNSEDILPDPGYTSSSYDNITEPHPTPERIAGFNMRLTNPHYYLGAKVPDAHKYPDPRVTKLTRLKQLAAKYGLAPKEDIYHFANLGLEDEFDPNNNSDAVFADKLEDHDDPRHEIVRRDLSYRGARNNKSDINIFWNNLTEAHGALGVNDHFRETESKTHDLPDDTYINVSFHGNNRKSAEVRWSIPIKDRGTTTYIAVMKPEEVENLLAKLKEQPEHYFRKIKSLFRYAKKKKKSETWVGKKIKKLLGEGKKRKQAIAIALSMAGRSKNKRKGKATKYSLADEEAGFHKQLEGNPKDQTNHLVYADWLEDNGKPTLASFIRLAAGDRNLDRRYSVNELIDNNKHFSVDLHTIPDKPYIHLRIPLTNSDKELYYFYPIESHEKTADYIRGLTQEGFNVSPWSKKEVEKLLKQHPEKQRRSTKPTKYSLEDEEKGFHKIMEDNPNEKTNHLVYADWLEENDFPNLARFIRKAATDGRIELNKTSHNSPTHHISWQNTHDGETATYIVRLTSKANPETTFNYLASQPSEEAANTIKGMLNEGVKLSPWSAEVKPFVDAHATKMKRATKPKRYSLADEEAGFHKTIEDNPEEKTNHLVYADWLEENGKPNLANYIRLALNSGEEFYHHEVGEPLFNYKRLSFEATPNNNYLHVKFPLSNPKQEVRYFYHSPDRQQMANIIRGLLNEGFKSTPWCEKDVNSLLNKYPQQYAAYKAPAGGIVVRGVYYKGGSLVPDLQKFASNPTSRLFKAIKKYKALSTAQDSLF